MFLGIMFLVAGTIWVAGGGGDSPGPWALLIIGSIYLARDEIVREIRKARF